MDMNAFSLKGKIAWITGASYGIGFAIAEAYAAAGATIVFNDINQELVDKGLKSYTEKGIDAKGYVCDVTNEEAVQALVKDGATSGVQIDPTQYRKFSITSVPSLVVFCEAGHDVIRGNLHLKHALEKVMDNGECKEEARELLNQGGSK